MAEKIWGSPTQWETKRYGYIRKTVDFTSSTWNTVATHELYTVTGVVRIKLIAYCTESLTDTGGTATIQLGVEGTTNNMIAATTITTIDINELWYDNTPAAINTPANVIFERVINGLDIGYQIVNEALLDGTLVFELWWEGLSDGATISAGAGGAL